MIKKTKAVLYNENLTMQEKLFRIFMPVSMTGFLFAAIMGFVVRRSWFVSLILIATAFIFQLTRTISLKRNNTHAGALFISIYLNFILAPFAFMASGGAASGAPIWFALGIIFSFLMLHGAECAVMVIASIVVDGIIYYVGLRFPMYMLELNSREAIYIDSCWSMIFVGVVTGLFIHFQNLIYKEETSIAMRQKEEIEKLNEAQSNFFSKMSHEIRTPINTIIGMNELNLREEVPQTVVDNCENIEGASRILLSLIDDILDLSRLESGKMSLELVRYQTEDLFSDVLHIARRQAIEKGLTLTANISPTIPRTLYGDKVRLQQILLNLLINAIKYTDKGSVILSVQEDGIGPDEIRLHISVADTGIGIRKDSIPYVFDSFQRVDERNHRGIEGSGLGLAICKQFVELMGGKISVDSIYSEGSTFHVALNQKVLDSAPIGALDVFSGSSSDHREKYVPTFEAPEAKVLIVDDDAMNRVLSTRILSATRIQVDTAKSGREALEYTRKTIYHLILMDHKMAEMDGVETFRMIRIQEEGLNQKTPIVAMTASALENMEDFYRNRGFAGYITKPITGKVLENIIMGYIPKELLEIQRNRLTTEEMVDARAIGQHKRRLLITTDCTADIPREVLGKLDIRLMPFYVVTSEGRFRDGAEIDSEDLLSYLGQTGSVAHVDSSSVEEYERFFGEALLEAEEVIHIAMASHVGAGFETAMEASRSFEDVTVVDSGQLSCGIGLLTLRAIQMVEDGFSRDEVIAHLEDVKQRIHATFLISSIELMTRNELLSTSFANFCSRYRLRPSVKCKNSSIRVNFLYVGSFESRARRYIKRELKGKSIDRSRLFLVYSGCSAREVEFIRKEISRYVDFEEIIIQSSSATNSCGCGLGAFGLVYETKE